MSAAHDDRQDQFFALLADSAAGSASFDHDKVVRLPDRLKRSHAELYDLLRIFYNLDTVQWLA